MVEDVAPKGTEEPEVPSVPKGGTSVARDSTPNTNSYPMKGLRSWAVFGKIALGVYQGNVPFPPVAPTS